MKTTIAICVVASLLATGGCAPRSRGVPPTGAPQTGAPPAVVPPPVAPPAAAPPVGAPPAVASPLAPGAKLLRFDALMLSRSPELRFHFVGTVERRGTAATDYEYVVRSTVAIQQDERAFPAGGVHLTKAVFTASVTAKGHSQARRTLLEVTRRIDVTLGKKGARVSLPELHFTLPASMVAQSDRVSLSLTDGHIQVQVIPNLKGRKAFE